MTNFIKTTLGALHALYIAMVQYYPQKGVGVSSDDLNLVKYFEGSDPRKVRELISSITGPLLARVSNSEFCSLPYGGVIKKSLISSTAIINDVNFVINGIDNKAIVWIECPSESAAQAILSQFDDALSSDKKGMHTIDWDTHLGLDTNSSADASKSLSLKNSKSNNN
ncbi:MAG: hypothetical protein HWE16_06940 [Gammaproteobacteria bacterium]|nr:hypothetical protein [Gammaproteobacteria bacterium]